MSSNRPGGDQPPITSEPAAETGARPMTATAVAVGEAGARADEAGGVKDRDPRSKHYDARATTGMSYNPDLGTAAPDEDVTIWPLAAAAQDPRTRDRVADADIRAANVQGVKSSDAAPATPAGPSAAAEGGAEGAQTGDTAREAVTIVAGAEASRPADEGAGTPAPAATSGAVMEMREAPQPGERKAGK